MATKEVQALRHEARDAVATVPGLLNGVPGLTRKDQKNRLKAAEAALSTALEAVQEAREIVKSRKKG